MKLSFRFGLCSLLFGLTLSCASPRAHAATLTVCPSGIPGQNGCDYIGGDSIQTAVNAAASGDTILLRSGTYTRTGYSNYDNPDGKPRKAFVLIPQTPAKTLTLQGEGTTIIDGANSTHSLTGILLQGGTTTVKNLSIQGMKRDSDACFENNQRCGTGIGMYVYSSAQATISNTTVSSNQSSGILLSDSAQATVNGNQITGNRSAGVALWVNSQATITNNTIDGNQADGIICLEISACSLLNNIVVANKSAGIIGASASNITNLRYNLSWNNTSGNFNNFFSSSQLSSWGNISQDPRFISATDFRLQPGSPAIDAGDPAILDSDGSRSDMGAYGGPGAAQSACNMSCTKDADCGQESFYCQAHLDWTPWQNQTSNVSSVGSGEVTSFSIREANGMLEQHLVKGGEIWYRMGNVSNWGIWENHTTYVQPVGSGTITSFKSYTNAEGIIEQYLVRGGKIWHQEGTSEGWSGFEDLTSNLDDVGSGAITSFSAYLTQGTQIYQHVVRDGKIYTRDNLNGWSSWQDVSENLSSIGDGTLASFTAQVVEDKLTQYFVRNGVLYSRAAVTTNNICRLRSNPQSAMCEQPPSPSVTVAIPPTTDHNNDGITNLLDLQIVKEKILEGTFTIFHYNTVLQALLP